MKLGLVRHFRVNLDHPVFVTSGEFEDWARQYDIADVHENEVEFNDIDWDKCYCSDLPRAVKTAETIYDGNIIKTSLLREVPMCPVFKTRIKLPHVFWSVACRFAWLFSGKSQSERRRETIKRVHEFLNIIKEESCPNILVVCHGFFMYSLQKELRKIGFKGRLVRRIRNGTLYLYEK